jgi:amino-acid N-acetyltransferase
MNPKQFPQHQVYWFRHSAPYIHAYRGRTVVILIPGEVLQDEHCDTIIQDISLLNSLGLRLVICFGSRPQIEQRLQEANLPAGIHHDLRITDKATLRCVTEAVGRIRCELEAALSMGLANSPMHGAALRVASGNYVVARPVGVVNGIDLCHTGLVRKIHADAISQLLDRGQVVLLPNLGYSPTGEIFNLASEDVASSAAIALQADKLILFGSEAGILNADNRLLREVSLDEAVRQCEIITEDSELRRRLLCVCRALNQGVKRAHLISYRLDGALLQELFTRDGTGTLVTKGGYDQVRSATIDDVAGILALIQPLEEAGLLVRRSRELLEQEIGNFIVDERDGTIIACAALYPFPREKTAELACVAVSASYASQGRGERLLANAEKRAKDLDLKSLFVLTTSTAHWFIERGFAEANIGRLPVKKQVMYNIQRNSKVFLKSLE